jgi:uncharacterized repeat protein (TIGR03803 family)
MKTRKVQLLAAVCGFNNSAVQPKLLSTKRVSATQGVVTLAMFCAVLFVAVPPAQTQTETVFYSFANSPHGANPRFVTPVLDANGNLYGTTNYGGAYGYGTVFKVTSSGKETILHSFDPNGTDGAYPWAGLVRDRYGNFYGTTVEGGDDVIDGTVFKLTHTKKGWTETILHSFGASQDGSQPYCVLTLDATGNLYGTTNVGGAYGYGTVFELTPSGTETTLWSFGNGTDGANPLAGVALDKNGNLYGTTEYGGAYHKGIVFKLTASGTETILWNFGSGKDGANPYGGVILCKHGNLCGTTANGGVYGDGTVFEVTPSGMETILHSFDNNDIDGFNPYAGLVMDKRTGNLYGTTINGGGTGSSAGIVFKLTPSGTETILHTFGGSPDGASPWGGLVLDTTGNLYGTTFAGGTSGNGTLYKVTP